MALDEGLDTGPVYVAVNVPIGSDEHADALTRRLGEIGTTELLARLRAGSGLGEATPQRGEVAYAEKLSIEDHHLDFSNTALGCLRVVRIGRAWTTFRDKRLIIHSAHVVAGAQGAEPGVLDAGRVATKDGALVLGVVQLEGRSPQAYAQFANGVHLDAPERLG
jgi:methionyl-tRNA formyltransferase